MKNTGCYPAASRERSPSMLAESDDAWDAATDGLPALHRRAVVAYFRDGLNLGQTAIAVQRSPQVASRLVMEGVGLIRWSGSWSHLAELTGYRPTEYPGRMIDRLPNHPNQ